jgi:hypothetical protein
MLVADPAVAPAPPVTAEDKTLVSSPAPPLAGVRRSVAQKTLPAVNTASRVPRYVADRSMAGNATHRRRASLKSRPLRSTATAADAPRRAHWRVETVERQKYGVLAPGWVVVEADPTAAATEREQNGAIETTPVMLDIPMPTAEAILAESAAVPVSFDPNDSSLPENL